jgi:O-antigen ligase
VFRRWLALLRLLLLYGLGCFLILHTGLALRQVRERGWGLEQPAPRVDAPSRRIPSPGITIDLIHSEPATQQADLSRLHEAGFDWVRQRFDWATLEPAPGRFDWAASDQLVAAIHQADLIPVALLDGSPAWARTAGDTGVNDNPLAPPADPADFAAFAAAFALRYGVQVQFYQLWDEPNIAPHWGARHIEPVDYARLLKQAAIAIRQADPDAVILLAALAPTVDRGHTAIDEVYFLQRLYAAGAAPYFDAVAVESFGFGWTPSDPRQQNAILNFQRVQLVRRAMIAAGDGATPIWMVRYGWNTRHDSLWGTVSAPDQQDFAGEALTLSAQWPWLATTGWMIDRPAAPVDDPMWGYALTPELQDIFVKWRPVVAEDPIVSRAHSSPLIVWSLAGVGFMGIFWRGRVAVSLLPWGCWRMWWLGLHWSYRVAGWLALGMVYYFTTWPPLILACWLVAAVLIAAEPLVGLVLAVATIPLYFQHKEIHLVDATLTLPPAYGFLLCLLPVVGQRFLRPLKTGFLPKTRFSLVQSISPIDWCAISWLVLSLLSMVNVWHWLAYGRGMAEGVAAPLIFYLAVRVLADQPAAQRQVGLGLLAGGLLVAGLGLADWVQGGGTTVDGVRRLVGPYFSANHAALYLERTLFLVGGLLVVHPTERRPTWFALLGIITIALLLTASRGAWLLGVPAGLLFLFWAWRRRSLPRRFAMSLRVTPPVIAGLACVAGVGAILIIAPWFWERMTNVATINSRGQLWLASFRLWQSELWFGVGPGGFFWRYPAMLSEPSVEPNLLHPHNVWLEVGVTGGVTGFVWLVALLSCILRLGRENSRQHMSTWPAVGLLAGLAAAFAHAQVDAFFALPDLAAWNWVTLGLLAGVRNTELGIRD